MKHAPDLGPPLRSAAHPLALCSWCLAAAAVEAALYASYRGHDARTHYFTHGFLGWAAALFLMTAVVTRSGRPARRPLLWLLGAHLFAMLPDVAFSAAGIAHQRWMDVFLLHISSHFVPGRNWTWLAVFLAALALYLRQLNQLRDRDLQAPAATP